MRLSYAQLRDPVFREYLLYEDYEMNEIVIKVEGHDEELRIDRRVFTKMTPEEAELFRDGVYEKLGIDRSKL